MTRRCSGPVCAFLFVSLPIFGCKQATLATNQPADASGPSTTRVPNADATEPRDGRNGAPILIVPDGSNQPIDVMVSSCQTGPNEDFDKDGYSVADGDCNDCDSNTNPGAFDVPGNNIDEDCNGVADDEPEACDSGPASTADDPMEAARALGLCRTAAADVRGKDKTWGVVSAKWVFPDGTSASLTHKDWVPPSCAVPGGGGPGKGPHPLSRSTLSSYGPNVAPQNGKTMVALSSGLAQATAKYSFPWSTATCTLSKMPPGFPVSSTAACPGATFTQDTDANDGVALELAIRTPSNAHGFSFDFDFYTAEFPTFVCTGFNDFFAALLDSKDPSVPANRNISFDKQGNPVCVNNAFVEVCTAQDVGETVKKHFACPLGRKELQGTAYDDPLDTKRERCAATSWLRTNAKIVPGETITIRFAIWDAGDERFDSTVLLDNFLWVVEAGKAKTGTNRPYIIE